MSLYFRSRMQGALGLSFKNEGFSETDLTTMANEIGIEHDRAQTQKTLGDLVASTLTSP